MEGWQYFNFAMGETKVFRFLLISGTRAWLVGSTSFSCLISDPEKGVAGVLFIKVFITIPWMSLF
jgi:hypothetical protein